MKVQERRNNFSDGITTFKLTSKKMEAMVKAAEINCQRVRNGYAEDEEVKYGSDYPAEYEE